VTTPEAWPPEWIALLRPVTPAMLQPIIPGSPAVAWYVEVLFERWAPPAGVSPPSPVEAYRKTVIVGESGDWSVAEIELVRRMRAGGWSAGWVDTFGSAPRAWDSWIVDPGELPTPLRRSYNAITNDTGRVGGGGQPDVIAWRGETLRDSVLIEFKGPSDKVRPGQDAWLRAALRAGLSPDQFVVAKWPKGLRRAASDRHRGS
jgi:hypothetical protein